MSAQRRRGRRPEDRWTRERRSNGVCWTCRKDTAQWMACHQETRERWPVCSSCRRQAARLRSNIVHTALAPEEDDA